MHRWLRQSRGRLIVLALLCITTAFVMPWLRASWQEIDPLRTYRSQPRYHPAAWHDVELTVVLRRLDNLSRKRDWDDADATFIRALIESGLAGIEPMSPRTLAVAPVGIRDLAGAPREITEVERSLAEPPLPPFPAPGDLAAEKAWFGNSPEGREMARWLDCYHAVTNAEALIWDRRRQGIPVPESLQAFGIERWTAMLSATDAQSRVAGAGRLISGRFIEDPNIRVRVEAIRVGDRESDVKAQIDRMLVMYDRHWHGVDPEGPIVECNTCP